MNSKIFQSGFYRYFHLLIILAYAINFLIFPESHTTYAFFFIAFLLILFFRIAFNYYSDIRIVSNELVFNDKIKIPLSHIKYIVLNFHQSYLDLSPSYLFITDQYGRTGKFYFNKSREEFNLLEDELVKNNVKIGIELETNNTLKEAYSN